MCLERLLFFFFFTALISKSFMHDMTVQAVEIKLNGNTLAYTILKGGKRTRGSSGTTMQ